MMTDIQIQFQNTIPRLLTWYKENARNLPWRVDRDPYHVWVSEIMLQQTRVEAVKPYYARFLKRLPNVESLARIPEDELLKLWEGLGYYSRVRNMQKAARTIMEDYDGSFPDTYEEIRKLSGIGPYTAGAISSISFRQKNPAVDGNVMRVVSRIRGSYEDITLNSTRKNIENFLTKSLSESDGALDLADHSHIPDFQSQSCDPGLFNQALMEIGACVCIPNGEARCFQCPFRDICLAHKNDLVNELPVKAPKKKRRIEKYTVLILQKGNLIALRKRPSEGLLAGLYEFPSLTGHASENAVLSHLEKLGYDPLLVLPCNTSKHIFTHIEWHMTGYMVKLGDICKASTGDDFVWADPERIEEEYAVPSAYNAYLKLLRTSIDTPEK